MLLYRRQRFVDCSDDSDDDLVAHVSSDGTSSSDQFVVWVVYYIIIHGVAAVLVPSHCLDPSTAEHSAPRLVSQEMTTTTLPHLNSSWRLPLAAVVAAQ